MRKTLITIIALLFWATTFGQKTEIGISLNSGLFSFSGPSAEKNSAINYSTSFNSGYGYTNNPYGSRFGLCYGISGNLKRISKRNFIAGFDAGYERLRSTIFINAINGFDGTSSYRYKANGKTYLNYNFLNLYPHIGYRFNFKKLSFDLSGGFEVGYCLKATETGNATAESGTKYTTNIDRKTIKTDTRPRIQFSAGYHNFGIYIGYSQGLANYKSGYVGGTNECYARLTRFGLTYQLN